MDIKLCLVIENRIYREGISSFLQHKDGVTIASVYSDCQQAAVTAPHCASDILVVDVRVHDALNMMQSMKQRKPHIKIVMLAYESSQEMMTACANIGVEGVVTNNDSTEDLYHCITSVYSGHLCYPVAFQQCLLGERVTQKSSALAGVLSDLSLTFRQIKVMQLVEQGYSNKEIARQLNIELSTVKNHVHQILDRLHVKNRCEAASVFRRSLSQATVN